MTGPIAFTDCGKVRGREQKDCYGNHYFSFQGIPYAKPPTGVLRFKAPQPPEPWTEIKDATAEGNICFQNHPVYGYKGSEDCLFLNIYTRKLFSEGNQLQPVIFWIHGGGFLTGSGGSDLYGPDFLLQHDVVVVTINYRLGLLGFLCLEDSSLNVPGNAGLKDQVLALKWVQKNINQFGGDPNNVTLCGQSSGAVSIHYMLFSPITNGLFHKVIIQSGTIFDSWGMGQKSGPLISKTLNLSNSDEKNIMKLLKTMSTEEIFQLQQKLPDSFIQFDIRTIGVVIEDNIDGAFLSENPVKLLKFGMYHKVPMIIGYNSREGVAAAIHTRKAHGTVRLVKNFERVIPYIIGFTKGSETSKTAATKVKQYYYGDEEPTMDNIDKYYLLETDTFFSYTLQQSILHHFKTSHENIFFYRMALNSSLNIYKKIGRLRYPGACHGDEIGYLFKTKLTGNVRPESIEENGIKRLTELWTNFARYGNPNPKSFHSLINILWEPVKDHHLCYLNIDENLTIGFNPDQTRMKFWDEIRHSAISSRL